MATTKEALDDAELVKSYITNSELSDDYKRTYLRLINISTLATNGISVDEKIQKMTECIQLLAVTQGMYALNGMFCIDDTKDADTDEYTASNNRQNSKSKSAPLTTKSKEALNTAIAEYVKASGTNINAVMKSLGEVTGKTSKEYTEEDAKKALSALSEWNKSLSQGIGA